MTEQTTTSFSPVSTEKTVTLPSVAWGAVIVHEHGTNMTVAPTKESAFLAVVEFVDSWWDDEMDGAERPDSDEDMVEQYFERNDDESYVLAEVDVRA